MIAIAEDRRRTSQAKPAAPTFEELLPAIQQQAAVAFRSLPASEREELATETVANAFCAYRRLVERGLHDIIFSTPLAQYAIRQIRAGRRVGTKLNVHDVTSEYAQRAKGIGIERFSVHDVARGCWQEIVVEDKKATPADIAAMRIDFADWLRLLRPKQRRIAKVLATGETTSDAARKFRLSSGRISQIRRELRDDWLEFQGELAVA